MAGDDHAFDSRVIDLEKKVYGFEKVFERLSDDLHGIRVDLQDFVSVKGKLNSIETAFTKIDEVRREFQNYQLQLAPILSEHKKCVADHSNLIATVTGLNTSVKSLEESKEEVTSFVSGRVGHLLDWVFKIAILAFMSYVAAKSIKG